MLAISSKESHHSYQQGIILKPLFCAKEIFDMAGHISHGVYVLSNEHDW